MQTKLICSAAIAVCAGIFAPAARGSLVAYYSMNETSGSLNDSSGNGETLNPSSTNAFTYGVPGVTAGTYGDITVTPAESAALGTAISSNGHTTGGDPEFMTGTTAAPVADTPIDSMASSTGFTVMAWIDPASSQVDTGNAHFLGNPGGTGNGWAFGIYPNTGDTAYGPIFTTIGHTDVKPGTGTVPLGNWENLAVTYKSGTAVFYLNGVSIATGSATDFTPTSTEPFAVFGEPANNGDYLTGAIQQVQVYNSVLTAAQIQTAAVTVVPEPASVTVVLAGCVGLLRRRRRRPASGAVV